MFLFVFFKFWTVYVGSVALYSLKMTTVVWQCFGDTESLINYVSILRKIALLWWDESHRDVEGGKGIGKAKEHVLDRRHFLRAFIFLVVGCFKMVYMKIFGVLGRVRGDNRK